MSFIFLLVSKNIHPTASARATEEIVMMAKQILPVTCKQAIDSFSKWRPPQFNPK